MKSSISRLTIAAAAAALAGGCAGAWNGADQAISIAEEHPITVDSQIVTLTLDVDGGALSATDEARLRAFADAYLTQGHGPLSVTSPSGAGTGRAGAWSDEGFGTVAKRMFVAVTNADKVAMLVDRLAPDIERYGLVITIFDVEVIRGERF